MRFALTSHTTTGSAVGWGKAHPSTGSASSMWAGHSARAGDDGMRRQVRHAMVDRVTAAAADALAARIAHMEHTMESVVVVSPPLLRAKGTMAAAAHALNAARRLREIQPRLQRHAVQAASAQVQCIHFRYSACVPVLSGSCSHPVGSRHHQARRREKAVPYNTFVALTVAVGGCAGWRAHPQQEVIAVWAYMSTPSCQCTPAPLFGSIWIQGVYWVASTHLTCRLPPQVWGSQLPNVQRALAAPAAALAACVRALPTEHAAFRAPVVGAVADGRSAAVRGAKAGSSGVGAEAQGEVEVEGEADAEGERSDVSIRTVLRRCERQLQRACDGPLHSTVPHVRSHAPTLAATPQPPAWFGEKVK